MKVDRATFLDQLSLLKPALEKKEGTIPALSHIWFDKEFAYSYDGGLGIRINLETELECGVPGSQLLAILGTSTLVEASLEEVKGGLEIKMGRSRSTLFTMEASHTAWNFPEKAPKEAKSFPISEEFVEGLRQALLIKASPATRIEHHGIVLQNDDPDLLLYSTDSRSILQVILSNTKVKLAGPILLPRLLVEQIVDKCPEGATLYITDDYFMAEAEEIAIFSNKLDTEGLQDIRKILHSKLEDHPEPIPLPSGIEGACDRAQAMAGSEEPVVTCAVEGKTLVFVGKLKFGELDEIKPISKKHPEGEINLDMTLLKRAVIWAEDFSLVDGYTLALYAGDDWVYLIASQ